jgi:hypothetical protein
METSGMIESSNDHKPMGMPGIMQSIGYGTGITMLVHRDAESIGI